MSIINSGGYYFASSHHGPGGTPLLEWVEGEPRIYHDRDWSDHTYYYLEIKDGEALGHHQLRTILDSQVLRDIRDANSDVYLVINNSHEAFLSVVDPIYRHVIMGHNIPEHKLIIMSGSFDLVQEIDRVANKYKLQSCKAELVMDFEGNAHYDYHVATEEETWLQPNTLHHGPYEKKFLNFNRRWRLHRPTFVMLLKHYGILDQGFVSLAPSDCGNSWNHELWMTIMNMHQRFPDITYIAHQLKEELMEMPDLYLDTPDLVYNHAPIDANAEHNRLYEQSYFSLVSETHYYMSHKGYEPTRFLSEKAWKPILFKHPFIMISTPNILSCLKQIGYKTFDGIIDESYDSILDDGQRMLAIVEETKRLASFTDEQRNEFIDQCKEICEYNFNVLTSKSQFTHRLNF